MKITKENLSDIKEGYEKAHKIIDEESQNDPETEPFRSHYAARDLLNETLRKLKPLTEALDTQSEADLVVRCIHANILKDIGRISLFTEELSSGEASFREALALVESDRITSQAANIYIDTINQLGVLYSNRGDQEQSKEYLMKAKDLYAEMKEKQIVPLTMDDLFGTKDEIEKGKGMELLEKNYTLTLYYLAQVFGFMDNLPESARFCHLTLKRQLDFDDYGYVDWALNAATLSQYFFEQNHLQQSRHLLAAASHVMDVFETEVIQKEMNPTEKVDKQELHRHRLADIGRCWAKYGIYILSTSKQRLCEDEAPPIVLSTEVERFTSLDVAAYEDKIIADFCLTFDDAKAVMQYSYSWLMKAKEYYTMDTAASQYAKIVQDVAELYKNLAFFNDNESEQCKLYKRSADQLEELSQMLNATYYKDICRTVWYELGLLYSKMLNVKHAQLEECEQPAPHALSKINKLSEKSISNFQKFLESYKIPLDTLIVPEALDLDTMHPILFCLYHIGLLYYRMIATDKRVQLANVENSCRYYVKFVECCDKNKAVASLFNEEVGACREMTILLPLQIKRLKDEISTQ